MRHASCSLLDIQRRRDTYKFPAREYKHTVSSSHGTQGTEPGWYHGGTHMHRSYQYSRNGLVPPRNHHHLGLDKRCQQMVGSCTQSLALLLPSCRKLLSHFRIRTASSVARTTYQPVAVCHVRANTLGMWHQKRTTTLGAVSGCCYLQLCVGSPIEQFRLICGVTGSIIRNCPAPPAQCAPPILSFFLQSCKALLVRVCGNNDDL